MKTEDWVTIELNGFKYSKKEFDGFLFKGTMEFAANNKINSFDFYTDNPNKESAFKALNNNKKENVKIMKMISWGSKDEPHIMSDLIYDWLGSFKK